MCFVCYVRETFAMISFNLCLFVSIFVLLTKVVYSDDVFNNRFSEIRFSPTFIDKTPLIYEVFKHKNLFISAPKHFGKSTNIGLLNMFLSNLRQKDTIIEYFNGTKIWEDEKFVREHLGEHPVILYNASANCVVYDEDHMAVTVLWTIHNAFADHRYLLRSHHIDVEDLEMLQIFLDEKKIQSLKMLKVTQALNFLARLLYQHHGKPVILLADGFGCGLMERIIEDNLDLRYLTDVVANWYNALINSTLTGQHVISHSVMSGETWLYGLSGIAEKIFTRIQFMRNTSFMHFYGFTYEEVEYLMDNFNIPSEDRDSIVKWYCGYTSVDGELKVCNPYSILQYFHSPYKTIKVYWSGSPTGPDLLQRMVAKVGYRKHLLDIVNNRAIKIINHTIIENVTQLRRKVEELQPDSESFICQVLLEVGYVTFSEQQSLDTLTVKFPNEEIRSVVDKFISLLSFI